MIKKTYIPAKPRSSKLVGTSTGGRMTGGISSSAMGAIDANSHTHSNKSVIDQLTQADINVLEKLSLVDGNLRIDANAYSTGELSAFGFEEGQGGGVIINVIDNLTSTSKTDPLSANQGRYLKTLIDNIEVGEGGQVIVDWEAITGKPTTFAPSAHTHIIGDVTGLQGVLDGKASLSQLDGKEDKFTKNSAFNKSFGTGLNDVARGNHTHAFENLTSKPTTLSGYGITNGALTTTNIIAGNGLTGGGTLAADRTIKLGTPSTLTASTTNVATNTSHTHAITTTSVGAANTIIQTDASGGTKLGNLTIGDWSLLTEISGTYFTIKHEGADKMSISTSGSGSVIFYNNLFTDGDIAAGGSIISEYDVTAYDLIAYDTVTTPKVSFGNGWTAEGIGEELQFKLNGVIQAKIVNGALVSIGEVTAFY